MVPKFKYKGIIPYVLGLVIVITSYKMFPNSLVAENFIQKYVPYIMISVLFGGILITVSSILFKKYIIANKSSKK